MLSKISRKHWSRLKKRVAASEAYEALVDAVVARYDLPQRWYALKARVLGLERLADYDRSSSVAETDTPSTSSGASAAGSGIGEGAPSSR